MVHTPIDPHSDAGRLIQRLGYAGLTPFVVLALLMWIVNEDAHPFVAMALSAYAATIAAFLGGIHWGIGLRHNATVSSVVGGMLFGRSQNMARSRFA